jgi:hypothetical protein
MGGRLWTRRPSKFGILGEGIVDFAVLAENIETDLEDARARASALKAYSE